MGINDDFSFCAEAREHTLAVVQDCICVFDVALHRQGASVWLTAGAGDMPNAWKADLFVTHDKDYNNAVGLALALKQNEVWLLLTRQSQPRARLLAQKPRP